MDEQEQEQKNKSSSSEKEQLGKGKDKLKEKAKKKIIKKVIAAIITYILKAITPIITVLLVVVLLTSFLKSIFDTSASDTCDAKASAISLSLSENAINSENAKVKIKINDDKSYAFTSDYDDKEIKRIKSKINSAGKDSSHFSDFEIQIIGALIDNGMDIYDFSEEELKCLPLFIRAEACTQYLDLRPNSEKMKSGKYVPQKIEDLAENEVPGVILVQRTNTNGNNPVTLEYKKESEFNKLVESNNKNAINYFTINNKGNLIIAKWNHTVITVNGTYPKNLPDLEKETPKDEYIITTEEIAYSEYIKKYTMPFDFLVQLLIISQETGFCSELTNCVLNSKIVINIQEEETVEVTDETKNYTVHNKDNKYIDYEIKAYDQSITRENSYLLKYAKDDEDKDCTNYSNTKPTVKIHTEYTSHSYAFEIIESDTWIAHYIKTYKKPKKETEPTIKDDIEAKGEYKELEKTENEIIETDKDVQKFISENKTNYQSRLVIPEVTVTNNIDNKKNKYKQVIVRGLADSIIDEGTGTTPTYNYQEEKVNKKGTGRYNLPVISVYASPIAATDNTKEIPSIKYTFIPDALENNYIALRVRDNAISCNVSRLNTKNFEKIDTNTHRETTVTKYPSDPNPTTNTHIYAKDDKGNFEKFLLIYDKYPYSRDMMDSAASWLFDMMEDRESTIELVDIVKALLNIYNRKGSIDKIDSSIFEPDAMMDTKVYGSNDYVVNTERGDKKLALTKEQLKKAIEKTYTGKTKDNLLSSLNDFMYIQQTNKVNSVFAVAVTIIESSGGTNWAAIDSSTYNWYSIKGSYNGNSKNGWRAYSSFGEATRDFGDLIANEAYYFKDGKYTVTAIAPTYCNEKWGEDVVAEMTKIYNNIGIHISTAGKGGIGGTEHSGYTITNDGYPSVFTVGTRTFKNFKQFSPAPWGLETFKHHSSEGKTIGAYGCSVTSIAIIASGFGHDDVTPLTVAERAGSEFQVYSQSGYTIKMLSEYTGMNATWEIFNKNDIIKQLKEGNPVVLLRDGSHWWTVLSINEDGTKAYVSDPGRAERNCWELIDNALYDVLNGGGLPTNYVRLSK